MATAPVSKSANNQPALDKNGAPIRVVTPDQQGNFQLKIGKGDIAKVHIVDVDMVLYLNDGTKLVLAGGAIGAMDDTVMVDFSNGRDSAAHMMDQVGIIPLQKLDQPRVLSTEPQGGDGRGNMQEEASYRQTEGAQDLAAQAQAANAAISAISKAMVQLANVVQSNSQPVNNFKSNYEGTASQQQPLVKAVPQVLPERPGVTPQEFVIGPNAPALSVHLTNTVGSTQDGLILKGSGGSSAFQSDTNTSNIAQIAPQIINAGNDVNEIWANGQQPLNATTPSNMFSKVLDVQITGDGKVQSLTISGVPANMTIVGATFLGNGVYQITVSPDTKNYKLELRYETVDPNPNAPIHADFKLNFELAVVTTDGIQVLNSVRQVVLKDATTADDLNYANPVTGESALVLPAQGISHVVHAGDNAGTTIYGSNANDFLYGGTGNDILYGGKGNTYFEGGAGNDTIVGGVNSGVNGVSPNINTVGYTNSTSGVMVDLNTGNALDGFGGHDTLQNIQKVIGSAHDDTFIVGANTKGVDGGSGGKDTIDFSASNAAVTVNLSTGTGTGGYAQNVTFTNIENVVGSSFDDTFIASSAENIFDGGAGGSNTVSYANSPSSSTSGVTVDLLNGVGSGNDATGDKYINIQNVIGSAYNDTFVANLDANHFDGMGGVNTVSYAGSATGVEVDFYKGQGSGGNATGDSYKNIQNVIGSSFDDKFVADTDSLNFDGGAGGTDTVSYERYLSGVIVDASRNVGGIELTPAVGNTPATYSNSYTNIDKFVGTAYADTFIASNRADNFDGLGGVDTVSYAADTVGVVVNLVTGLGSGAGSLADGDRLANIENVIGGSGNDTFIANDSANVFDGGAGSNTVDYSESTTGAVTVDLFHANGVGTSGGFAQGDKFINIQNVIGSTFDDTFVASAAANTFDGAGGNHNRVSYANDTVGVTVDLVNGQGSGVGSLAAGDKFFNIQDATGGSGNDTFIASDVANAFNGGSGTNTVSYEYSDVGVTVDLVAGTGTGGYADGDTLTNIQNVKGSTSDDLFIANSTANSFVGNGGVDTVSYIKATDGNGVTVDLNAGVGTGGYAEGDRYDGIRNATGTSYDDTFVASNLANTFDGGLGSNTVSYAASDSGVTVNLLTGVGTGGYAQDDRYISIQNAIGSASDDLFIANGSVNRFDGGVSTAASHNRVSYATDTADLTIDLLNPGVAGIGGNAEGDTYVSIQDVTGGLGNDTFIASTAANNFDGGGGTHNRVSYATDTANLTIDLLNPGATGVGGGAQGDTYTNIQDITGGSGDDTFIASAAANNFDGGTSTATSHNRVSYASDTANLTIDLLNPGATGVGGNAQGDTYTNIQDITGGSGDDTFIASAAANNFDGGTSTATSHNRVSYATDTADLTIDLLTAGAIGVGGNAQGDTYTNIQDLTGGLGNDTFIASAAANAFDGGGGTHNRVSYATDTADLTIDLLTAGAIGVGGNAQGDTYTNIQDLTGGLGNDTFIASAAANAFDGGGGTHNRVSYATDTANLIINLSDKTASGVAAGTGSGGYAAGDTYTNIQDATGGSGNDIFVASLAANNFDGGTGTNTVSYESSTTGVTVNLSTQEVDGLAGNTGSGSYAAGDTYTNIQNVIGSTSSDTFIGGSASNVFTGNGGSDTVSYASSGSAVTVNLSTGPVAPTAGGASLAAGTGRGGDADGDTYFGISNVTGSTFGGDEFFAHNTLVGTFNGNGGAHDRVSYSGFGAGTDLVINLSQTSVTVGAVTVAGGKGSVGKTDFDTYIGIQDATGGAGNDTFISGSAANAFDGGTGSNTVNYAASDAGVIVNFATDSRGGLATMTGSGGYAEGDTYRNVQNVVGSRFDDLFYASNATGAAANKFDGGVSDATSHNRVSYESASTAIIVNLAGTAVTVNSTSIAANSGAGGALGDTYANIQDITGGSGADIIVASLAANNINGGGGTNNTVHYGGSAAGVIVNLSGASVTIGGTTVATMSGANATGAASHAAGDTYTAIQNVTGSASSDIFIGGIAANVFTGNGGSDTVSYASSGSAVTVNLSGAGVTPVAGGGTLAAGTGRGGDAQGDTYNVISNVTGSIFGGDEFFANGSLVGTFDGNGGLHDRVSYSGFGAGTNLIINLSQTSVTVGAVTVAGGKGSVGKSGLDTYIGIHDATGGAGNDTFIAGTEANAFNGGAGSNTVNYAASEAGVIVNFAADTRGNLATMTGGGGAGSYAEGDVYTNIQNVTGSSFDDIFYASAATGAAANRFDGGVSNAASHNRVSYEAASTDVLINLFNGAATLNGVSVAANSGAGGAAGDTYANIQDVAGGSGNDTFNASAVTNRFDGGNGVNTVSYQSLAGPVNIDIKNMTGTSAFQNGYLFYNIQNLIGTAGNDTLGGAAGGNSTLTGGAGADALTGYGTNNTTNYAGNTAALTINLSNTAVGGVAARSGKGGDAEGDTYTNIQNAIGGTGNDLFIASADVNAFNGGAGNNTVSYAGSATAVIADLNTAVGATGDAIGDTFTNIQNLTGTAFADKLTGLAAGGSILIGGAGADQLIGLGYNGSAATANTANYAGSGSGVTINLSAVTVDVSNPLGGLAAGAGRGGDADGDTLSGIQNLVGSSFNDTFYASSQINVFNGGVSDATSHNRVVYTNTTGDMIINLSDTTVSGVLAGRGSGGDAASDTYINIQDVTGGGGNDTLIGGAAANYFDGGGGNNTVSYASTNSTAVTVDLFHGSGTGGYAQGDTYANIQNVIGSSGNDLFYASTVANNFNGGSAGNDTVSYKYSTGAPIVASLVAGVGGTGGDANGDQYTSIENLTGSENVNSSLYGDGLDNILTALGLTNTNLLDGGGGVDILDGRQGGHNTLNGGLGGDTFYVQATGGVMTNITAINGGGGLTATTYAASTYDTLKIFGLTTAEPILNMHDFLDGKVSSVNRIDVTGDGTSTKLLFTAADVQALVGVGGTLTVMLDNNTSNDAILANGFFGAGQNGSQSYYAFYSDSTYTHEIARINVQYV
ncbi:Bifunctional hemolysin/adenylate cyclase precursor [compost metagenome]